ncbi:hypothetical protein BpHYR1_018353 [Brachionus plicatilis]|uniref:Uncharacterized protein n=1 Tax=Brachionus plicatilis TaxID=10195 RepID=A0A3M7PC87_BRAPC|nr:hypothetical protein BpHYR1_018353 [Brachionus plicatilis]
MGGKMTTLSSVFITDFHNSLSSRLSTVLSHSLANWLRMLCKKSISGIMTILKTLGVHGAQLVQHLGQLGLQVVQYVRRLLVQTLAAHGLVGLFQLDPELLHVVDESARHLLLAGEQGELASHHIGKAEQYFGDAEGKAAQVAVLHVLVLALELFDDVIALVNLREHVHHRRREQTVLGRLLKAALFVLVVGVVQILHGYVVVVVEPVHDKRLEPGIVVGHVVALYWPYVLIVGPEVQVVGARRAELVRVHARLQLVGLVRHRHGNAGLRAAKVSLVQLVAVLEQEAIGGLETRRDAFGHCAARSGRAGQLLDLHAKESDAGEQVHCGLEVLETLAARAWKVVAVH